MTTIACVLEHPVVACPLMLPSDVEGEPRTFHSIVAGRSPGLRVGWDVMWARRVQGTTSSHPAARTAY
jgi:hypothetical protein